MPTKFKPQSKLDYSCDSLNTNLKGTRFTALGNQVTIYDFLITEDNLIDGAQLHCIGANLKDKITFQVVDKDNVLGTGLNKVLGQYVTDWHINPQITEQFNYVSEYPAKLLSGVYLRIIYTSAGASSVEVLTNFRLHKVLW
jgi:hypothetical protein